jgi:DNA-binding transcriptional regulator LsrR (DeoR family)
MSVRDAAEELGMSKSKVQRLRQQARDKDLLK